MNKGGAKQAVKVSCILIPFCLAMYGSLVEGRESLLNAAFDSVNMYLMNYAEEPSNIFIEIARWTAPLATAGGVLAIVVNLRTRLLNFLKYARGKSVAVYGDGADREEVLAQLGARGIRGEGQWAAPAEIYILMFPEEEQNYNFYQQNFENLKNRKVYMKSTALRPQSISYENLHLFQCEEAEARVYWKKYGLLEEALAKNNRLSIVLIGCKRLGRELLIQGVQNNIFHPDQKLEYHIFDVDEKFIALNPGIKKIEDKIIFHKEEWYREEECLQGADRILVCDQDNSIKLLDELRSVVPCKRIDVFSTEQKLLNILFSDSNTFVHNPYGEGSKIENILHEELFEQAKQLNLNYAMLYGATAGDEKTKESEWKKLDAFTRYSNVSAVDYHEIRKQMLKSLTGDWKTDETAYKPYLELFAELEHIRWCRYHYLNNWQYGIPADGRAKDPALRIHKSLVPYHKLDEAEKEKDRESIRCMFKWQS